MPPSISNKTNFRHKKTANRLRQIPTGACVTPTKHSTPIYSNIKHLCSENGNNTYVIHSNETTMHTRSASSDKYSLNSSVEDLKELDRLIEFHANTSQRDRFHYDSSAISLDSSALSETLSNISWIDPKCSSKNLASEEGVEDCSKLGTENHMVKYISGVSVTNEEIRINIHETPKRTNLKSFERGKKQKPLRLANLPRKVYTRGKDEVRIMKEDIKIVEPNSNSEMFDIKKHLARTRRKLTFHLEDSFKTSSSSFTSNKPQVDSHKNSSVLTSSSWPSDDFYPRTSTSVSSSMPQEDSEKLSSITVTSIKTQKDSDNNTTGFMNSRDKNCTIKSPLHEVSDMEKRAMLKDNRYFGEKEKNLEQLSGKFLLEYYLAKLKGIASKPPTTKRAKEFEMRTTPRTYFDFDDYCMQIFNLKEKFNGKRNKNMTV